MTKDGIKKQKDAPQTDDRHRSERLFPFVEDSCELTVECPSDQYSASKIARAVEDAEAHLLNLNVVTPSSFGHRPATTIDLRINHRNAGSVARSLERYGFNVTDIRSGIDADTDLTRQRIEELMMHIDI